MAHKAGVADGVPVRVVLLASRALRPLVDAARLAETSRVTRLTRRSRPAWDVMEAGFLRSVCGLPFDEIATRLGLSTPASRSRAMGHGRALRADPGYACAASDIVHRALAIDFRGGRRVLDLQAVLRGGSAAGLDG